MIKNILLFIEYNYWRVCHQYGHYSSKMTPMCIAECFDNASLLDVGTYPPITSVIVRADNLAMD